MLPSIRAQLLRPRPNRPEFLQSVLCFDARRQAAAILPDVGEELGCFDDPHIGVLFGEGATHARGKIDPNVNRLVANLAYSGGLSHGQAQSLAKIVHRVASLAEPTEAVR